MQCILCIFMRKAAQLSCENSLKDFSVRDIVQTDNTYTSCHNMRAFPR